MTYNAILLFNSQTSDPQLVECIKKMVADEEVVCTKIVFNLLGVSGDGFQLTPDQLNANTAPLNFIHASSRLFGKVILVNNAGNIQIVRHKPDDSKQDTTEPFDRVDIINKEMRVPTEPYTRLIAASQKHLHQFSIRACLQIAWIKKRRYDSTVSNSSQSRKTEP